MPIVYVKEQISSTKIVLNSCYNLSDYPVIKYS
jgi:hypothetical protein